MASINFNPFEGWFSKPPNPIPLVNLHSLPNAFFPKSSNPAKFASISSSLFGEPKDETKEPGYYTRLADQFFWECENLPDYRHTPEVEKILKESPVFETKENPTEEEMKENERWWKEFRSNPIVQFIARAEEINDEVNKMELEENKNPYWREDRKFWRAVPHVPGLDGRPMPRKAIKTKEERHDKFWDFTRQFFFGLWGFRQRPYPPGRPIDVAQAIGYKKLEKRYYDFIMKTSGWWYKDRLGRSRGPMELIQLKTAWGAGIIDKDTFIWGEDMDEWAPICMVYGLERAVATWEVRLAAAATSCLHKLQKGIPPWVPLKGYERKTYKQLQEEAIESKKRDLAVLEANDGVWPGVRIPSHALFLWASGSEMTSILEADHMPNKYIPKDLRKQLMEIIPDLRPWEVLSVEQAMDKLVYTGRWYRKPLGSHTWGPPYIRQWNRHLKRVMKIFLAVTSAFYECMQDTIPGFDMIMKQVREHNDARVDKVEETREFLKQYFRERPPRRR